MDFNIRDVNIEFSGMNIASHHDYILNYCNFRGFNFRTRGNSNGCNSVTHNAMTI